MIGCPPARADEIRVFLSHAAADAFEAQLLQYVVEHMLRDVGARAWTYSRDQEHDEDDIAGSLKAHLRASHALIFLLSPATLESSGTQWMELAYADAFEKPVFILLHHLQFADLATRQPGVPPLVLSSQCNDAALDWRSVIASVRDRLRAGIGTRR